MNSFRVSARKVRGRVEEYEVLADGTDAGGTSASGEGAAVLVAYIVEAFDENGIGIVCQEYPVRSYDETEKDDTGDIVYKNNGAEVLEKIKQDYPPEQFENYEW